MSEIKFGCCEAKQEIEAIENLTEKQLGTDDEIAAINSVSAVLWVLVAIFFASWWYHSAAMERRLQRLEKLQQINSDR